MISIDQSSVSLILSLTTLSIHMSLLKIFLIFATVFGFYHFPLIISDGLDFSDGISLPVLQVVSF